MIDISTSGHCVGDCRELLKQLPDACVQTCVTSPPYWGLRDYGHEGQIGLESTPDEYVRELVAVFADVRRVLRDDGTLWLNLGDCYAGSGRGGYAGGKSGLEGSTEGQDHARRARGSQKAAGMHESMRLAGAVARAWVPPPVGLKHKDLVGIPWRVAFALQNDGWWLRDDIIWHKPNPMPSSVEDRTTKAHEYLFLLSKRGSYHYDAAAIAEDAVRGAAGSRFDVGKTARRRVSTAERTESDTRNCRSVWTIATQPYDGAHFATMPPRLAERCVLAGSRVGDIVLDPFFGSGTVGMVAEKHGRRWIGFDLGYEEIAKGRTAQRSLPMGGSR